VTKKDLSNREEEVKGFSDLELFSNYENLSASTISQE